MGEKLKEKKERNLKKYNWIYLTILCLILVLGFYLRFYHADYPVVGYHNWKETHYLTEARNFARDGFFKYGFFTPYWDYPKIGEDPSGVHSDTFPTTSILVGLAFRLFGTELVVARLVNIFLALGSIIFLYLLLSKLFNRDLAIICAFIAAINPLLVFFGRQVQLINASLFFGLMGMYYFLLWIDGFNWKNTLLFIIPTVISIMTKYTFAIFLIPMAAVFPFRKLRKRKYYRYYAIIAICAILGMLWIPYSANEAGGNIQKQVSSVSLSKLFEDSFWQIMRSYAADNYTLLGLAIAGIGLILFIFKFLSNHKKKEYRFFMAYFLGSIVWFLVMAFKLSGHNYHQYPLLPLVIFFIGYAFTIIAKTIQNFIPKSKPYVFWIIAIIFCSILVSPSIDAKNRMFGTQFPGLDIAGDYIYEHKVPDDVLMHSSHQAYGVLWNADIKGTGGLTSKIEEAEELRNVSWVFIYIFSQEDYNIPWDEKWDYLHDNYHLVQWGFQLYENSPMPTYYLFKKGGSFDPSELDASLNNGVEYKDYELFGDHKKRLFYVTLE